MSLDWTKKKSVRALLALAGTGLSALLIGLVFCRVRWDQGPHLAWRVSPLELLRALPGQVRWVLPFAALTALMLAARAWQWQAALRIRVGLTERFHLVAIGAFVHNALPGKLGDVTRAYLLGRDRDLPFVESLGSVAACKLFEFVWLVALAGGALSFAPGLAGFGTALRAASLACFGLVVLAFLAGRFAPVLGPRLRPGKLRRAVDALGRAFAVTRSARALANLVARSVAPVLCSAIAYGWALQGVGIARGLWLGPVVLGAIPALGQSLLLVPAGTGLYYLATTFTATQLGASPEQAAVFATCTHLATLAPQLLLGAVSLWRRGIGLSGLRLPAVAVEELSPRSP